MMRTANPALNANVFQQARSYGAGDTMTLQGTINKTLVLLFLLVITASWVWGKVIQPTAPMLEGMEGTAAQTTGTVFPFMIGGAIAGFIIAMVTVFRNGQRLRRLCMHFVKGFSLEAFLLFLNCSFLGLSSKLWH
jgi:uncharacterized YccA/Bax inhibitor family protein